MSARSRRPLRLGALTLAALLALPAAAQQNPETADTASASSGLGRLFFTPERRQQLDRQRQFNIKEQQAVPDDPTLTINGVVTRSSGKRTVWINGVAQNDNEQHGGATVTTSRQTPGQVFVEPPDAPSGSARVGDTIKRSSGETTDLLGGGHISHRAGGGR